jgi:membrane protein YdbS with pleckstrin-like domain
MEPEQMSGELRAPAHQVSRRAILFWTVRALIGWVVIAGVQLVILILPGSAHHRWANALVLACTVLLAAVHLFVMPRWRYRVHRWEITQTACYSQSGWITQERRIAPLSRIQTVDSERGPLEQLFKLANITVTTASAAGAIKIHGLDSTTADRVVHELTTIAALDSGDAT